MPVRVLVVDDSRDFLDAARTLLEREGLPIVGIASSLTTAIREAERLHPDVVLIDIMLGSESGFEVAQRLTDRSEGPVPIVIFISTLTEGDVAELGAANPPLPFLPKSELSAAAIRRLLPKDSG